MAAYFGLFSTGWWGWGKEKIPKWIDFMAHLRKALKVLILNPHAKMPNGREITRFLKGLTYIGTSSIIVCDGCTMTQNIFTCIPANNPHFDINQMHAILLTSNILKFPATFKH